MTQHRIYITGASSGLGAALAELYARQYGAAVTLGLVARRAERLAALAAQLEAHGARVLTYTADVCDRARMAEVGHAFAAEAGGVSLAIANAGISGSDRLADGDATAAADTMNVNVGGVIHTLQPLVPLMMAQGHGHLVAIGSVAGFVALPGKAAYCASKAAVKTLMDGWRPLLGRQGVKVSTICPGFVHTELTEKNPYPMPFIMDAQRAARLIARAIARGKRTYVFPWQMRLAVTLVRLAPERLVLGLTRP